MEDEQMEAELTKQDLINSMKTLHASVFALYLKSQYYHWNVTGPNFAQYHDYFGELYEELWESVDTNAEEIRKLDAFAPGSLIRFSELTAVGDEQMIPDSQLMFTRLASDNDIVLSILYNARNIADEVGAAGTLNYLEGRISVHEKHAWMLKSF